MKFNQGQPGLRSALAVCLAGLFFLLAMGVALLGGNLYRAVAADADENDTHRTALSYVVNQLRRGDNGGLAVGEFEGVPAARTTETLEDGSVYITLIYCYDGQLRELYMEEGTGLTPGDGAALMPLDSLDFALNEGLLTVTAGSGGERWQVSLAPRAGIGEVGAL